MTNKDSQGNILTDGQIDFFKYSKLVDEEGNLLVVYHISNSDEKFNVFDDKHNLIFFSDDKNYRDYLSGKHTYQYICYINARNILDLTSVNIGNDIWGEREDGTPDFTSCVNDLLFPLNIDLEELEDIGIKTADNYTIDSMSFIWEITDTIWFKNKVKAAGYDTVKFLASVGASYGVVSAKQIKSVTNTTPTSSASIREAATPKLWYHGSQQEKLELNNDRPLYVTNNKHLAQKFALGYAFNYDLVEQDKPTLYTIQADIKKPYIIKTEEEYEHLMDIAVTDSTIEKLKQEGYDSILYIEEPQYLELFFPKQQAHIIAKTKATKQESIPKSTINPEVLKEMKGKQSVSNTRILQYVNDCIESMKTLHYDGMFDSYINFEDIDIEEGDTLNTFGTLLLPKTLGGAFKLVLNKYMFDEPEETIKNTIYHELCHYVVCKIAIEHGLLYRVGGKWYLKRYEDGLTGSDYNGHGTVWKNIAKKVGQAFNQTINRTNTFDTHTGVGAHASNNYNYVVRCKHCGTIFHYTRMTGFVKSILDGNGHTATWWCRCKDGTKGHDFEIIKGE